MLCSMGIGAEAAPKFRQGTNGAAAMRELAQSSAVHPVGCTQVTEIAFTPGVTLVGPLPGQFELATEYCAAVAARAQQPESAARFAALLAGPAASELRRRCGFDT
jgi:molybdate transport system substrate-binding protein